MINNDDDDIDDDIITIAFIHEGKKEGEWN